MVVIVLEKTLKGWPKKKVDDLQKWKHSHSLISSWSKIYYTIYDFEHIQQNILIGTLSDANKTSVSF